MKCPKCSTDNRPDSKYCRECATGLPILEDSRSSYTKTLDTPAKKLTTGSTFANRYQITDILGEGGMGEVYRVLDVELNEEVALKLLKPEISVDEKAVARFISELKLARKIVHENVGRVFELMDEKGLRFISMEYVQGEDLKSFIHRSDRLSIPKAIDMAKQICGGLCAAHKLGVIHRDLKPSNVMIDKAGNAKIMDFGIARSMDMPDVTGTGIVIGTPRYMSPEQAEGTDIDSRSDIYSLGIILYEIVTGHLPVEPFDPRDTNPLLPEPFALLILKCLEKRKEERYQSASEVMADLNGLETTLPIQHKGLLWKTKSGRKRFEKKHAILSLLSSFAVIILIVVLANLLVFHKKKISIAILPFYNIDSDSAIEYLCYGIPDRIINKLSAIEDLKVVNRYSAFSYKGKTDDLQEVGRNLNARYLLATRASRLSDRVVFSPVLVDVQDNSQIWGQDYEEDINNTVALEEKIALAIVKNLKLNLKSEDILRLEKPDTESPEARELFLLGQFFWGKRTPDAMMKGLDLFKQAIEIDPTYALAYAGIAGAYSLLGTQCNLPPREAFPKARKFAELALQFDSNLAEAHATQAWISMCYDWDRSAAQLSFERSFNSNPNSATTHMWYGFFLVWQDRLDEALDEMKEACRLDPIEPIVVTNIGWIYFLMHDYENAIEYFQKALDLDPNNPFPAFHLGRIYVQRGQYSDAIEIEKKVSQVGFPWAYGVLGYTYGLMGENEKTLKLLSDMEVLSQEQYVTPVVFALIHIGLGDSEKAFYWIEKCLEERDGSLPFMKRYPELDSIRSDPRLQAAFDKVGIEQ